MCGAASCTGRQLAAPMADTILPVSKEVRDRLRGLARKGETYDELLRRLLAMADIRMLYQRERRILESEEFVPLDRT